MRQALLVALIGCIPGLLTPILSWALSRSREKKELRHLERALKKLEVIETLFRVYNNFNVSDTTQKVNKKLLDEQTKIYNEFIALGKISAQSATNGHELRPILRRMLLLYLPSSPKGWFLHVPFYMLFGAMIFLWIALITSMMIGRYEYPMLPTYIFTSVAAIFVLVVLQRFASKVDSTESKEE